MLNQFVLVGRLLEIKDTSIIIDTSTDKIEITTTSNIIENIQYYSKIGECFGIRGKITTSDNNKIELKCEKCTMLREENFKWTTI